MSDINEVCAQVCAPEMQQTMQPAYSDATFERMLSLCLPFEIGPLRDRVTHRAAARIIGVHWQTLHKLVGEQRIVRDKVALAGSPYSFRLAVLVDYQRQTQSDSSR